MAVIALGDGGRAAATTLAKKLASDGPVLTAQQWDQRLVGATEPRDPDLKALQTLLTEAREREAYFDTPAAQALRRQILGAFDSALKPDAALRQLAAAAALDAAAASFVEGSRAKAREQAREAYRRFGHVPIDSTRLSPPIVQFLTREQQAADDVPRVHLLVVSDRAGNVYADGAALGRTEGRLSTTLPPGDYRIWLEHDAGWSLPYPVHVGDDGAEVHIDAALDAHVKLGDPPVLLCSDTCSADLARLGSRLGVARLFAAGGDSGRGDALVWDASAGISGSVASSAPHKREARIDLKHSFPRFSPLYLIPFGGGQLAQHRPTLGVIFMVAEMGLLGWHLSARLRYNSASADEVAGEEGLRTQANLSLGLLAGALAVNVAEALIVGYTRGSE
jgi:hypothetical protein